MSESPEAVADPDRKGGSVVGTLDRVGIAINGIAHGLLAVEAVRLVVGLPVAENGEHPLAKRVERFARQIEGRFRVPVARVDERFSSVEAESRLRGAKSKSVDSIAAQLILEQYFDQAA